MNVFPEYSGYKDQFLELCKITDPSGEIIYFEGDAELQQIVKNSAVNARITAYNSLEYRIEERGTSVFYDGRQYFTWLIGKYNIENMTGAMEVCRKLGISSHDFLHSMQSFKGAARRQQLLHEDEQRKIFLDFAHAPSKVKATVTGFRENYPDKKLVTLLELHTYSSLNSRFLPQYRGSLEAADEAFVYFNPEVVKHKLLPPLENKFVAECFQKEGLHILSSVPELEQVVKEKSREENLIFLIMSSGNLGGVNLKF